MKKIPLILILTIIVGLTYFFIKKKPSLELYKTDPITNICLGKKNTFGNSIVPGEVIVFFKDGYSLDEIRKYINKKGYVVTNDSSFSEPITVQLQLTDLFMSQNEISIDEVNTFLKSARMEPYIKNIQASNHWYSAMSGNIGKLDRWGTFTITFSDSSKQKEFLKKYPTATLFVYGELSGSYRFEYSDKITILYKGGKALDILSKLKTESGLSDGYFKNDFNPVRMEGQVVSIFEKRNKSDTGYLSTFSVSFSNILEKASVEKILSKYPQEINIAETKIFQPTFHITLKVPKKSEECWAEQLENEPIIEYAHINMMLSTN